MDKEETNKKAASIMLLASIPLTIYFLVNDHLIMRDGTFFARLSNNLFCALGVYIICLFATGIIITLSWMIKDRLEKLKPKYINIILYFGVIVITAILLSI